MLRWLLAGTLAAFITQATAAPLQTPPTVEAIDFNQTQQASHPLDLLKRGIFEGWAKVSIAVDENGKLIDALVTGYSHPEFGEATLKAIQEWEFTPARIDGEPVSSVTQLNFNFNRDANGATVLPATLMEYINKRSSIVQPEENKLIRLDKLDGIPVPLHIISPAYSAKNARDHTGEKVIVRFYIDEKGQVRLPTLQYSDNPEIARQALAAVALWRFQPPLYQGKPVITRATQEFIF